MLLELGLGAGEPRRHALGDESFVARLEGLLIAIEADDLIVVAQAVEGGERLAGNPGRGGLLPEVGEPGGVAGSRLAALGGECGGAEAQRQQARKGKAAEDH